MRRFACFQQVKRGKRLQVGACMNDISCQYKWFLLTWQVILYHYKSKKPGHLKMRRPFKKRKKKKALTELPSELNEKKLG